MDKNAQYLITLARRRGTVDDTQYVDDDALVDLNIAYQEVVSDIVSRVSEDFFWKAQETDLFAGVLRYDIPPGISPVGMDKALKIYVKYSPDGEYRLCEWINSSRLTSDIETMATNVSPSSPKALLADNGLFILPGATEDITDGIKLYSIAILPDLTLSSTQAEIFRGKIPTKYYDVVAYGMVPHIHAQQRRLADKAEAIVEYEKKRDELVWYLSDRHEGRMERTLPDLSHLM